MTDTLKLGPKGNDQSHRHASAILPNQGQERDWCFLPLLEGEWRTLTAKELMDLMLRYAAEDPEIAFHLSELEVKAARLKELRSVKDGFLIEYEAYRKRDNVTGLGAFVYRPNQLTPIFGQAQPLHFLIEQEAVQVKNAEQALEWTKFYCASIQGRRNDASGDVVNYVFFPFQSKLPINEDAAYSEVEKSLRTLHSPATAERLDDGWAIKLITAFGSRLHSSEFKINENCTVIMHGDDKVKGLAALHPQSWIDGLRVSLDFDKSAFDQPASQSEEGI